MVDQAPRFHSFAIRLLVNVAVAGFTLGCVSASWVLVFVNRGWLDPRLLMSVVAFGAVAVYAGLLYFQYRTRLLYPGLFAMLFAGLALHLSLSHILLLLMFLLPD